MEINMKGYDLESFKEKDIWTWDEIVSTIEELEINNKDLQEQLDDLHRDLEENYTQISIGDQVDISDRDFI